MIDGIKEKGSDSFGIRRGGMVKIFLLGMLLLWNAPVQTAEVRGTVEEMFISSIEENELCNVINVDLKYIQGFGYTKKVLVHPLMTCKIAKSQMTMNMELKEAYLDIYLNAWDLRFGKQMVNWGSSFLISPTNVVNPLDYRREDPEQMQMGVWGGTAKYYLDYQTEVTGVVVGGEKKRLKDQLVAELMAHGLTEDEARARVLNLEGVVDSSVIDDLDQLEYGFHVTRRGVGGVADLSLCYYNGYEDLQDLQPEKLDLQRTQMWGANLVGFIGPLGIWAEGAINRNEDQEKRVDGVLGVDCFLRNGLHTTVQVYGRRTQVGNIDGKTESYLMMINQFPLRRIHQFQSTLVYDWHNQGILLLPELKFSLGNDMSLKLGTVMQKGQVSSSLEWLGQEKIYLKISWGL